MSTVPETQGAPEPGSTRPVTVEYPGKSEVRAEPEATRVLLALDGRRGTVGVRGRVRDAALFRDALATCAAVLGSDLRYKHRDRAAYLAYLAKKGKKASAAIWEAQKAFIDEELGADQRKTAVLDPVLTVHPDEVSLEVFSRDESSYARLAFASDLFEGRQAAHGSACVDLGERVLDGLDRIRTYLPVDLDAGTQVAAPAPAEPLPRAGGEGIRWEPEKRALDVSYAWIRGFLQVQSAATLPAAECEIAPVDLYNVLYALRTRKAKKPPRALRFELVPGAPPRIILEPWEIVLESHGPVYRGGAPRVVRTFGRQRLLSLARVLPHARRVRVRLVGGGLPVFWHLDLGRAALTVGLTGWTESGWSSAAAFDALMPAAGARLVADRVHDLLAKRGPLALDEIVKSVGKTVEETRASLQLECLRGRLLYDLGHEVYRPRTLLAEAIDDQKIRYGSPREARAHRLLGDGAEAQGEVKITKLHDIVGEGLEVQGEVQDREAHRGFTPRFSMDAEGRVKDAACGCPTFRRSGLREGPCEHLLALRLAYARERARAEAQRLTPEGRKLIRAETRTYVRREPSGAETVYRVSLDQRAVALQWGARTGERREQRLWYDTDAEARDAYFGRLAELAADGFVDAEAAG
jgi:hypothetical protein